MRKLKFGSFFIATLMVAVVFALPSFAYAQLDFPTATGYVNDFENILSNDEELEQKLVQFEAETSNEIVIVTVSDFQETYIEDFALQLFEEWGIGKKDKDNGVLILVSDNMHESRIEVGYGLEGALTDALTGRIQDDEMIPYFKEGDYNTGINEGLDAVMAATKGEYEPRKQSFWEKDGIEQLIFPIFFFGMFIYQAIAYSKSWWLGGVIGFVLGIIFWGWVGGLLAGIVGLVLDLILSILYRGKKRPGGSGFSSLGGYSSSSSSGGSSFGGFGGGSSGGGGSSRSW